MEMTMRFSFLFGLIVFLAFTSVSFTSEASPAFRVLIVHKKGSLKSSHEIDAKGMEKSFKSIAEVLGMPLYVTRLECNRASRDKVSKWCSTIKSQDRVVLYYSGPDSEKSAHGGVWPLVKIGKTAVPVDWIAKKVHSRHAKLSLVFVDCYNQLFKPHCVNKSPYGQPLEKVERKRLRQRIKDIWIAAQGELTMCSKKNSKISLGLISGRWKCGAFTEALMMAIDGGACGYTEQVKLSDFPKMIRSRMQELPFHQKKIQRPIYRSTLREGT